MADRPHQDRTEIEVFAPDARPRRRSRGGLEPVVRRRRRGVPRWARWAIGASAVGLVAAVALVPGGDEEPADEASPSSTAEPTGSATPNPNVDPDPSDGGLLAGGVNPMPVATSTDPSGTPVTQFEMVDGTTIVVTHPPRTDDTEAAVYLGATLYVTGSSDCCSRPVTVHAQPFDDVAGGREPAVELFPGEPGRGAVFADGDRQALVFAVGGASVVVPAFPGDAFTPAELILYRDLLVVSDAQGFVRVAATPPLAIGQAQATVVLDGDPGSSVTVIDRLGPRSFGGGCVDELDGAPATMFTACVDGMHVRALPDPVPERAGDGAPQGPTAVDVEIRRPEPSFPPLFELGTLSGQAGPGTVSAGGTDVVAGGGAAGVVVGASVTRGAVSWVTSIGDSAFIAPTVPEDSIVLVAPRSGALVALDALTGNRTWELQLAQGQGARAAALTTGAGDIPQLIVTTSFDAEGDERPPVVYAVDAESGELGWRTELDPGGDIDWWQPVHADGIVIVGDLARSADGSRRARLYGLAWATGERLWTRETDIEGFDSRGPQVGIDGIVVARVGPHAVESLDPATGATLWRHEDPNLSGFSVGEARVAINTTGGGSIRLDTRTGEPVG